MSSFDPQSPEYWKKVLKYHRLGNDRGRMNWISYVGSSYDLEAVLKYQIRKAHPNSRIRASAAFGVVRRKALEWYW